MRIADVLKHNDDGGGAESSFPLSRGRLRRCLFSCSSPLSVAVEKLRRGRKTNRCFDCKSEGLMRVKSESDTQVGDPSSSGQHAKDVSFTIGLGVGLAVLTAASKNEFNKMMKLRLEMETLIKEVKEDLQRKDAICHPSKSSDILASSTTSYTEVRSTNDQSTIMNCAPFYPFEKTTNTMDCDNYLKRDKSRKEDFILGVDKLEAEFEVELERLQFRLDVEEFSEQLQQQCSEPQIAKSASHEESLTESLGELEDPDVEEQQNGVCPNELKRRLHELLEEQQQENTSGLDSSEDHSSFGEIDNTEETKYGGQSNGVSPNRLERRLHELLEAKQAERIEELESALEHLKHKFCQKEMELSWWKDTAKLISQNVADAIHLSS